MVGPRWVLLIQIASAMAANDLVGLKFSSNKAENVSLAVQPGFEHTSGFTLCFRGYFINLQASVTLVDDRGLVIYFKDYTHSKAYLVFGGHKYSIIWPYTAIDLNPFVWYSFCLVVETTNQVIRFSINTLVALQEKLDISEQGNLQLGGKLFLGNSGESPFVGKLTDLNVWSEPLSDDQLRMFATCNVKELLDAKRRLPVRWSTANLDVHSSTVKTFSIGYDQLCLEDVTPKLELFYNKLNADEARGQCGSLNGILPLPNSDQDLKRMKNAMANPNSYIWLPITWSSSLNKWISDDGQEVTYMPWAAGQPNGDGTQNCVVFASSGYNDVTCGTQQFHLCEIKKYPPWRLRGACSNEKKLDSRFAFHKDDNGLFEFRGFAGLSSIIGRPDLDSWDLVILDDMGKENITIGTRKPFKQFPFGLSDWKINKGFCGSHGNNEGTPLKLTKCKETEFTCSDGSCLSMEMRCDVYKDCLDSSDEMECRMLSWLIDDENNKFDPPMSNRNLSKTLVNVSVSISHIGDPDEMTMTFLARFSLRLTWTDHRTTLENLKNFTENYNYVVDEYLDKLWMPGIVFSNAIEETSLKVDEFSSVVIVMKTESLMNPKVEVFENEVYEGSGNPFRYNRTYELRFRCQFDLTWYPFDSHDCSIEMALPTRLEDLVKYVSNDVDYTGPKSLMQFEVFGLSMVALEDGDLVRVSLKFRRMFLYHLTNTYLPCLFLILIAESALYFKKTDLDISMGLSLTIMLVIYTMYQSVAQTLPTTAYIKFIDAFLIFGLLVPFSVFIVQLVSKIAPMASENSTGPGLRPLKGSRVMACAKVAVPLVSILFLLIYCSAAVYSYNRL